MDNIELSFDTSKCPNLNDPGEYISCNLENVDETLRDSGYPIFRQFPRVSNLKAFIGFCNVFKFREGLHMCMVSRKAELEKKRKENRFKSRAAYLKACRSWPKKQKFFFGYVKDPGEDFVTMERFHRVKVSDSSAAGCSILTTRSSELSISSFESSTSSMESGLRFFAPSCTFLT